MDSSNILSQQFGLAGKDVWVFGGAGYLGQATVRLLAGAGAKVLCSDLENRAQSFVESAGLGATVTAATLDLKSFPALNRFLAEQMKQRGTPDGLVNMAFASTSKRLEDLTELEFDEVNHGALTATFGLVRTVGAEMAKAKRGSIVLFSSMYGMVAPDPKLYRASMNKNPIEYGVTKAGIVQMTKYLAVHWGADNVRCNCISPGPFPPPAIQSQDPEFISRLAQKTPLGRVGKPEEIAGVVAFLLSNAAGYITGHNLVVGGGWTVW